MDVLLSMHKEFCDLIFEGKKPLEFRTKQITKLKKGDIVYIYETYRHKGQKKVVGKATVKNTFKIKNSKMGFYSFMGYYVENILKDKELLEKVNYIYNYDLPNYDPAYKFNFLYTPETLDMLKETNSLPNYLALSPEKNKELFALEKKSRNLIKDCDNWLKTIGYYNIEEVSFYTFCIELENPIRYKTPLDISSFRNSNGDIISKAPQSWYYVRKE